MVLTPTPVGTAPAGSSPDLAVSVTAPVAPRVGVSGLFQITVANVGTVAAVDAVTALDLRSLLAGTRYAIESRTSTGGAGALVAYQAQPGVFRVDLGAIAAGASATIAVLVIPNSTGAIGLLAAVSDATSVQPDPDPANNVAGASVAVGPAVEITSAQLTSNRTIQLDFDAAEAANRAADLADYHLTTVSTASNVTVRTIRLRSASYDATGHRVTLRLAHPLPSKVRQVRLAITELGTADTGSTSTLTLARS